MSERYQTGPASKPEREPECFFCEQLLEQKDGVVTETESWRVLVSRDQGYLGRCMVIPKRHIDRKEELLEEEVLELHYLQVDLENAVSQTLGARMCNWTQLGNHAYREVDPKPHLHYHMRPRYAEAVEFQGRRFEDPAFGEMYDLDQRWNVDADPEAAGFKEEVATALRAYFNESEQ